MFQFYLSSIKRQIGSVNLISKKSFNSTLVQLKEDPSTWQRRESTMFQFYLSSIKSIIGVCLKRGIFKFQFYLSSIKRLAE